MCYPSSEQLHNPPDYPYKDLMYLACKVNPLLRLKLFSNGHERSVTTSVDFADVVAAIIATNQKATLPKTAVTLALNSQKNRLHRLSLSNPT